MKNFIIITLIFPILGYSQLTDTTCIKSRWIALKSNEINKDIFLLDSSLNETLDLVVTIKRLVESKKLRIYSQNSGPYGTKGWNYIDYDNEMDKRLKDSLYYLTYDPYFEIALESNYPLVTNLGEDSLDESGGVLYPPADVYVFQAKECDEIRIKENRIYNQIFKKFEYVPVGLSFYFKGDMRWRGGEKFWVDLNELFEVLENKTKYPWFDAIINKRYQGFQYMQVSCYDDEIKY